MFPRFTIIVTSALLLGACASGPDFSPPSSPPPAAGFGVESTSAKPGDGPSLQWWEAFGSPVLNDLVTLAIQKNNSLEASRATLVAAQERARATLGTRLPQVDATARAEYQRFNLSSFGLSNNSEFSQIRSPEFDLYSIGGGISYNLDLFGRNKRTREQSLAEAEAQKHATEAAHLIVAGRVVLQVLDIAALNDRLAATRELIEASKRTAELTERREKGGIGTRTEVLNAQSQYAADQAAIPMLEQQLLESRAMLATMLGLSLAELDHQNLHLADFILPADIPVAIPSIMVRKRPDILEAEAKLHAATAAVGMATAQLYPDITIGATLTQSNRYPENLFKSLATGFDLFGNLAAPIFHGGTLSANKRAAEAEARAAAAQYREVVTQAFGQVSGLLGALNNDNRTLVIQQNATSIADNSRRLSMRSFEVGNSGILNVIDATRSWQKARLSLIDAESRQFENITRLYIATAGGWAIPEQQAPAS